jgi:hypothetical protein
MHHRLGDPWPPIRLHAGLIRGERDVRRRHPMV